MFGLGNWIKETTSSTGTGNLTLASATGYDTFASQFGDATTSTPARYFRYVIQDGSNWETGVGHMSAATTLVRDLVQMTFASGTMSRYPALGISVSGSGTVVFCDANADASNAIYIYNATSTTGGVGPVTGGNVGGTVGLSANIVYCYGFELPVAGVYNAVSWSMSAVAGTKFRIGIYAVNPDGTPGSLLATTADITPATGAHNNSFSASVYLAAGYHYIAFLCDGAPTFNAYLAYQCPSNAAGYGGSLTPLNGVFVNVSSGWTALPDPFGSPTQLTKLLPVFTLTRSV